MERMEAHIKQKLLSLGITRGERLGVAVSGGADSMALLHCLCNLRHELNIIVMVYHMEHGIRGQRSVQDMQFVQRMCEKYGVSCITERADVPGIARKQGISLETAARQARYLFLDAQDAAHIATAHHMDDDAETVIMNLLRGSGSRGLGGIPEARGRYIRPMLGISRSEIEQYVRDNEVAYVHDDTNDDTSYTRNFIRNQLMPLFVKVNPQAVLHIAQAAKRAAEDDQALIFAAEKAGMDSAGDASEINIDTLCAQMPAVQKRMVRRAIEMHFGLADIEQIHVDAVLELARRAQSGKRIELPGGIAVSAVYGKLRFYIQKSQKESVQPFTGAGSYVLDGITVCCERYEGRPKFGAGAEYFDAKVLGGACFRHRREGDVIQPLGFGGTKRLSDYLSDRKVPLHERDDLWLLAKGNEVFWVLGTGVSETSKAKDKGLFKMTFWENTHA